MKIFNFFKKSSAERTGRFSEFLRHASLDEKKRVFIKAAEKANKDQRTLLEQARIECDSR